MKTMAISFFLSKSNKVGEKGLYKRKNHHISVGYHIIYYFTPL